MIRTKSEAGTGNVVEAVRHMRTMNEDFQRIINASRETLLTLAKEIEGYETRHLDLMDIRFKRNAYGRQLGSFKTQQIIEAIYHQKTWYIFSTLAL